LSIFVYGTNSNQGVLQFCAYFFLAVTKSKYLWHIQWIEAKTMGCLLIFFLEAGDKPRQTGPILDTQLDSPHF
jgi:hypothetical protein